MQEIANGVTIQTVPRERTNQPTAGDFIVLAIIAGLLLTQLFIYAYRSRRA